MALDDAPGEWRDDTRVVERSMVFGERGAGDSDPRARRTQPGLGHPELGSGDLRLALGFVELLPRDRTALE